MKSEPDGVKPGDLIEHFTQTMSLPRVRQERLLLAATARFLEYADLTPFFELVRFADRFTEQRRRFLRDIERACGSHGASLPDPEESLPILLDSEFRAMWMDYLDRATTFDHYLQTNALETVLEGEKPDLPVKTVRIFVRKEREKIPKAIFAVDGILKEKRVHEIASPQKTGKTLLGVIDLAVCLATGQKFLGKSVRRPYRVAVLQNDMSGDDFAEYADLIARGRGITGDLDNVLIWGIHHEDKERVQLDSKIGRELLEDLIDQDQPEILIIDSRNSTWWGKLNEDELREFGYGFLCGHLRDERGLTVIVVTHTPHADKTRSAGHHSWHGAMDVQWLLEALPGSLRLSFAGRIANHPPITFRREEHNGGLRHRLCKPDLTPAQMISHYVATHDAPFFKKDLEEATGQSKRQVDNWIQTQLQKGVIRQDRRTETKSGSSFPYVLTKKGKRLFAEPSEPPDRLSE